MRAISSGVNIEKNVSAMASLSRCGGAVRPAERRGLQATTPTPARGSRSGQGLPRDRAATCSVARRGRSRARSRRSGPPRCRRPRAGRWSRRCARRRPPPGARGPACCCRRPTARARRSPGRGRCRSGAARRCPSPAAAATRNGSALPTSSTRSPSASTSPVGVHREGDERVGDVGVDDHLVGVDERADRVEVHGRALLRDRYGEHGVREAGPEALPGQPLDTRRRGALADPDRDHARARAAGRRRPRRARGGRRACVGVPTNRGCSV